MVLFGCRCEQRPLLLIKRASARLMPSSMTRWKPSEGRVGVVRKSGHSRTKQVVLKAGFCRPDIGGHPISSFVETLVTFARESDVAAHRESACGGLEIFNRTG